ncbi:MAG: AAA family ATPase, partial [Bacillota bacterium]|nr:AAA family ATPase [Bacillota bacterium]
MYLSHIHAENLRKFPILDLDFREGQNTISGPNKWGKSTVLDAICYALTGKLMSGALDTMSLKPLEDTSRKVVIELTFATGWDGSDKDHPENLVFRKEYREVWATKRGSTFQYLSGHETICFVNGTKMIVTDYEKELLKWFQLANTQWFQILTDPFYFAKTLPWLERRKIVIDIIGEVKPEDVFKADSGTLLIADDLKNAMFSIDKVKATVRDNIDRYKKEKSDLDVLIKGAEIKDPIPESLYLDAIRTISSNMNKEAELGAKRAGIRNPLVDTLKATLGDLQTTLNYSRQADNSSMTKRNAGVNADIASKNLLINAHHETKRKAISARAEAENQLVTLDRDNTTDETLIAGKAARQSVLRKDWVAKNLEEFKPNPFTPRESIVCSSCGHDVMTEVNAALQKDNAEQNEKALQAFNGTKAAALQDINREGLQLKAEIDRLKSAIAERQGHRLKLEETIRVQKAAIVSEENAVRTLESEIADLSAKIIYSFESDETKLGARNIESTKQAIKDAENESVDTAVIDAEIAE